jgi:hypothetical protein
LCSIRIGNSRSNAQFSVLPVPIGPNVWKELSKAKGAPLSGKTRWIVSISAA